MWCPSAQTTPSQILFVFLGVLFAPLWAQSHRPAPQGSVVKVVNLTLLRLGWANWGPRPGPGGAPERAVRPPMHLTLEQLKSRAYRCCGGHRGSRQTQSPHQVAGGAATAPCPVAARYPGTPSGQSGPC